MKNPFDSVKTTFLSSVPFSKISPESFVPALEAALQVHEKEIEAITVQPTPPSFENTLIPWEKSGEQLSLISHVFFALSNSDSSKKMEEIAREIIPKLTAHQSKLFQNKELFLRIKAIYDKRDTLTLTSERSMLLKETYLSFLRNGIHLPKEKSLALQEIQSKLALLCMTFGENVRKDSEGFSLHISQVDQISGLSDQILEMAKQAAQKREKEGWVLTLDYPFYTSFMKTCANRSLREKLFIAFHQRGLTQKATYNGDLIKEILSLREQVAHILGYDSYPEFVLEKRMLSSTKKVFDFLNTLKAESLPIAKREWQILSKFAHKDGIEQIEGWDVSYYMERFKEKYLALDMEKLRRYFPVEKVVSGLFTVAKDLFQISLESTKAVDTYHKDVKPFLIKNESGEIISLLYLDLFYRSGKKGGAWMTTFQQQAKAQKKISQIAVICNFATGKKSLLSFEEVRTLFHEFGHALHAMLSTTEFESLSGTQVPWDFVELPSQIMENWIYEERTLAEISAPCENGSHLSKEDIKKLQQSRLLFEGYQTLRQTGLAMLDMKWHTEKIEPSTNILAFEKEIVLPFLLTPWCEKTSISTAFAHIFQGGYGVGYYSYKWSEVLAADAFSLFEQKGSFNREIARALKAEILSQGGTKDPEILYKNFRGKMPNVQSLLKQIHTAAKQLPNVESLDEKS